MIELASTAHPLTACGSDRQELLELSDVLGTVAVTLLDQGFILAEAMQVFEVRYLQAAVDHHGGNLSRAATALGIHRNTLHSKLQKNGGRHRNGA